MARTSAPEPNEVAKQIESGELTQTGRTRRTAPPSIQEVPAPSSRRTLPQDAFMKTRCFWPCPCGGTVPDAPEWCEWRKPNAKAGTYCTDAAICAFTCDDRFSCTAYKRYKELVKERHDKDVAESNKRREAEGGEQ